MGDQQNQFGLGAAPTQANQAAITGPISVLNGGVSGIYVPDRAKAAEKQNQSTSLSMQLHTIGSGLASFGDF